MILWNARVDALHSVISCIHVYMILWKSHSIISCIHAFHNIMYTCIHDIHVYMIYAFHNIMYTCIHDIMEIDKLDFIELDFIEIEFARTQ